MSRWLVHEIDPDGLIEEEVHFDDYVEALAYAQSVEDITENTAVIVDTTAPDPAPWLMTVEWWRNDDYYQGGCWALVLGKLLFAEAVQTGRDATIETHMRKLAALWNEDYGRALAAARSDDE